MSEPTTTVPTAGVETRGCQWTLLNALVAAVLALCAFSVYYLPAVLGRPLNDAPEARVAAVAHDMLQSGEWVVPKLNAETHADGPPLPYWLAAASDVAFFGGVSGDNLAVSRAAQLPPALCSALTVFMIIFFGSIFFGRTAGIIAGLILGTSHLAAHYAQTGYVDPVLMFACAAALCGMALLLSKRPGLGGALLAGFGLGLGILTKGHVPLVLIAVPVVFEMFFRRRYIGWFHVLYVVLAFTIALLIATPWFLLVERKNPGAIVAMADEAAQSIYKAPSVEMAPPEIPTDPLSDRYLGYLSYFYKGALGMLPWTALLLVGFAVVVLPFTETEPVSDEEDDAVRFFALYAAIGFLLLLGAQKKHEYYLLPLFPAVALSAGAVFGRFKSPGGICEERMGWWQLAVGVAGAAALCCAPFWPAVLNLFYALGIDKAGYLAKLAAEFSTAIAWFAIPLALMFFAVNFLCARFWTTGHGVISVSIYATLAIAGLVFATVRPAAIARRNAFWANVTVLKQQTDALPGGSRLYSAGASGATMNFYTGRMVRDLTALPTDPDQAGVPVFLIVPEKIASLYGVPLGDAERKPTGYALIELTAGSELDKALREAVKKNKSGER